MKPFQKADPDTRATTPRPGDGRPATGQAGPFTPRMYDRAEAAAAIVRAAREWFDAIPPAETQCLRHGAGKVLLAVAAYNALLED